MCCVVLYLFCVVFVGFVVMGGVFVCLFIAGVFLSVACFCVCLMSMCLFLFCFADLFICVYSHCLFVLVCCVFVCLCFEFCIIVCLLFLLLSLLCLMFVCVVVVFVFVFCVYLCFVCFVRVHAHGVTKYCISSRAVMAQLGSLGCFGELSSFLSGHQNSAPPSPSCGCVGLLKLPSV